MTKEDQVAFHKWDATRAKTAHSNIQAWESACAYKDKRITDLEFQIKGFQANYNDTGKLVNGLRKRIAELEKALRALLDRYASLVASGDCGSWEWRDEDECQSALLALSEGDGEVLDERYFCVCGEPVYAGEISCLKCGTPRPAYTRHPSKSEGGADECKWVEDKTDRCLWNSSCGWVFRLDTDDPPDIGWKYCPRCGKPIRTAEGGADD